MGAITNRMLGQEVLCDDSGSTILWGNEDDGALNGGTKFSAIVDNPDGIDLIVTILIKPTIDAPYVANSTTVTCPNGETRIDVTDIVGYGARLSAIYDPGGGGAGPVGVAVQVQQ